MQQRRELREALARVQQLATRDRLTGLYNRRHMQQELVAAARATAAAGFSIALVDLDHFKRINDQHGHRAGDLALDRLGAHLAGQPLDSGLHLAFSAGLAWHKPHHTLDHTLERADRALYLAKQEGRDLRLLARDTTLPAPLAPVE